MGKNQRVGASVYFDHMSNFNLFFRHVRLSSLLHKFREKISSDDTGEHTTESSTSSQLSPLEGSLLHVDKVNIKQGPVVQSVVSLTSLLRVILLPVLADSMHNILIFFAEKM